MRIRGWQASNRPASRMSAERDGGQGRCECECAGERKSSIHGDLDLARSPDSPGDGATNSWVQSHDASSVYGEAPNQPIDLRVAFV